MKFEGYTIDDYGMAGVITTVKTDHVVGFASKEIGDLSFAFVAPLGADDCSDFRRVGRHVVSVAGLVGWRCTSRKINKIRAENYRDKKRNKMAILNLFYLNQLAFSPKTKDA